MHRLLQGDVGSGKTIVALFAALLAVENDYQAAVMAPTELLAEQHARTFAALLAPLGMSPLLVTGALTARERKAAATRLASSEPLVVVGTHALTQEGTQFARLGLAIVDEQHRFGVEQRLALGKKGERPDVLLMSATPIPRSLALTLYGDLDVSVLDERPPGRQPVTTALRPEKARAKVLEFIDAQVGKGRQAYVVSPADRGEREERAPRGDEGVRGAAHGPLRGAPGGAAARPPRRRGEGRHACAVSATARSTCSSRRRSSRSASTSRTPR